MGDESGFGLEVTPGHQRQRRVDGWNHAGNNDTVHFAHIEVRQLKQAA